MLLPPLLVVADPSEAPAAMPEPVAVLSLHTRAVARMAPHSWEVVSVVSVAMSSFPVPPSGVELALVVRSIVVSPFLLVVPASTPLVFEEAAAVS